MDQAMIDTSTTGAPARDVANESLPAPRHDGVERRRTARLLELWQRANEAPRRRQSEQDFFAADPEIRGHCIRFGRKDDHWSISRKDLGGAVGDSLVPTHGQDREDAFCAATVVGQGLQLQTHALDAGLPRYHSGTFTTPKGAVVRYRCMLLPSDVADGEPTEAIYLVGWKRLDR